MELIQSFWSKPFVAVEADTPDESLVHMGWVAKKYFYFSWVLSCLRLSRLNMGLTLITDALGREILIDKVGLPYTKVDTSLNALDHYPATLWAIAKLYTYSLQSGPFMHFDYDLFFSGRLDQGLGRHNVVALHIERDKVYDMMQERLDAHIHNPSVYCANKFRATTLLNSGVLGGSDITLFRELYAEARRLVDENPTILSNPEVHPKYVNRYVEFILLSNMCEQKAIPVYYLLDGINHRKDGLGAVYDFPSGNPILHINHEYRQNPRVCEQLGDWLMIESPDYYSRIMDLIACGEL